MASNLQDRFVWRELVTTAPAAAASFWRQLGAGTVHRHAEMGRFSVLADPKGAVFALWTDTSSPAT